MDLLLTQFALEDNLACKVDTILIVNLPDPADEMAINGVCERVFGCMVNGYEAFTLNQLQARNIIPQVTIDYNAVMH